MKQLAQMQMLTVFGAVEVGNRVSTPDRRVFQKKTHNKALHLDTNELYYFDASDRVYVNVGQHQLVSKYFSDTPTPNGSILYRVA